MAERGGLTIPDRLQVFVSSTIAECAVEREAARRAISGLNFEPVLFEREGARAEPPGNSIFANYRPPTSSWPSTERPTAGWTPPRG
jgi:Domain of unknown function (DUF4062)